MKKILITLLALGSAALGADGLTQIVNIENVTTTAKSAAFGASTSTEITVALTLNVDALKNATNGTTLITLNGAWEAKDTDSTP